MARVAIILEDELAGVCIDIRNENPAYMRGLITQTPAQRIGQQLHELAMIELRMFSLPPHRKQFSETHH